MYYGVQRSSAVHFLWEIEFWSHIEKEHTIILREAPDLTAEQLEKLATFHDSYEYLEVKAREWQNKLRVVSVEQYPLLTADEKKSIDALIRDSYRVTTQFLLFLDQLAEHGNDQVNLLLGHIRSETLYFIRILQYAKYLFQIY